MCSQERAISDTIAALGDGADHERNKHPRNAKPLHPTHYFSIELSMPFSPLGLAASRTSGPLTEDSERVTAYPDIIHPTVMRRNRGGPACHLADGGREVDPSIGLGTGHRAGPLYEMPVYRPEWRTCAASVYPTVFPTSRTGSRAGRAT